VQRSAQRTRLDSELNESRERHWLLSERHWAGLAQLVSLLGILSSLWRVERGLLLYALLALYAVTLLAAQLLREREQGRRAPQVDVHLLIVTLVFALNTNLSEWSLSAAPLGSFIVAAAFALSPAQRQLVLLMLIFTLELGWALKYANSVVDGVYHAMSYGLGLALMTWLTRRLKALYVTTSYPPSPVDGYEGPVEAERVRRGQVSYEESDATVQELSAPRMTALGARADEGALATEQGLEPPEPEASVIAPAMTPYYGSSLSGEHDIGLATRQVKPFEPPERLDHIRRHAQDQRKRPLEFLDLSCAIMLGHLAEQLSADSAVLVWRRNKSGGREAAVRWRWTKRPSELWQARYFNVEQGYLREAMGATEVFQLSRGESWDGALPYYHPKLKVARMLAVPICPYGEAEADGLLMIDRDLDEPWTSAELDASFRLAQKINLDVDISRFMKQLVHNSGLSDALLLGLSNLNDSQDLDSLAQALLEGVVVHDVCRWVAVCAREDEHIALLATWSKDQQLFLQGERYPMGADAVSRCLTEGVTIEAGAAVWRDPELAPLERASLHELFPVNLPALERCSSVHIKPLCDPYGEQVYGAIILGVEHHALLTAPYINPIDLIIEEGAVKMSWLYAHEQLRQQAMVDGLTQLFNHRSFQSELDLLLKRARRAERSAALILLDIDHFKSINDRFGHPFGDLVLKGVAGALKESMREIDLVARYGGEEFAIALEEANLEDVRSAAERARLAVEALSFTDKNDEVVRVTISLGAALFPDDAQGKAELIDRADQSLYEAKRRGRNQVRIWSESIDERNPSRMWTRHPVPGSQELRGIDALITPSGDELELGSLFETGQQRLLEERSLRADGRVAARAASASGDSSESAAEPPTEIDT